MAFNLQLGSFKVSLGKSTAPDFAWARADGYEDGADRAKLVTPYAQSAWVYIAVNKLARKVAQIPFRISRIGGGKARQVRALRNSADPRHRAMCRKALGETILDSGPAVDLFNRPHPTMNRQLFWEMLVTWFAMRGEFFILPLDTADQPVDLSERNARVDRLITLPTELFWHNVQGYDLVNWRYTGSPLLTPVPSEILLPSEVIHCRMPNPYLYWRGMSPLIVAMVAAGSDYAATQYAKGYWLNNADTGVIVTTEQQASTEQQAAILAALRERKRKAGTADRPLFLWGGAKVEKPQLNGMETLFMENRKMNRQEIAAIYEVPDSVMGFSEAKASALSGGSSALDSEQVSFIENTISPLCGHIEAALDPVVKTFGDDLVGWFDIESLPIMQAARRARLDSGTKAFQMGVPFNDVNHAYDLGFPDYEYGKNSYLPFNLQQVGVPPEPLPGEDDPDADKDKDGEKSNPFARMMKWIDGAKALPPAPVVRKPDLKLIWESHVARRRKFVKLFSGKVGSVLMKFRSRTLAKLDEVHLQKQVIKRGLVDLIFDQHDFGKTLLDSLTNPILNTLTAAANEMLQDIGSENPWQLPPASARAFIAKRTQPIQDTGSTVRDRLNTSLIEGLDAGETHAQLAARVRKVFGGLQDYEAERIATTEVNMAQNYARHETMLAVGIEFKAWLSSHGPTVRETHAEAEEEYIDSPIAIDEPFEVGDSEMMYPGDDSLGAALGEIINCHCIELAAQKKDEDEKSVTFVIFGLGEYKYFKILEGEKTVLRGTLDTPLKLNDKSLIHYCHEKSN